MKALSSHPGHFLVSAFPSEFMQDSQLAIVAFDTVAVVSSLSMVLIVITAWMNPYVRRSTAWYSMCLSFAVFPLLYLINVPFKFQLGEDPPIGMCTFQAVLIYAGGLFA